jgi:hypothetical protein
VLQSPRYSVPALLSLALSIGGATGVFSVFSAQVLRPLPFPREDELVQVGLVGVIGEFRELDSVFDSLATLRYSGGRMTGAGDSKSLALQLTSLDFFDTLGVQAEAGRTFTARGPAPDGLDSLALRHGFWIEAFGGEPMVGKTVLVDDVPKTVIGIIPTIKPSPVGGAAWVPVQPPQNPSRFSFFINQTIGRPLAALLPARAAAAITPSRALAGRWRQSPRLRRFPWPR